jgi:hypothetical protein
VASEVVSFVLVLLLLTCCCSCAAAGAAGSGVAGGVGRTDISVCVSATGASTLPSAALYDSFRCAFR